MKKLLLLIVVATIAMHATAQQKPSAQNIVEEICKQAALQHKNAFIIFHASWCGWCRKLDNNMNSPSLAPFFDSNYVTAHVTVFETDSTQDDAGAKDFLSKYNSDKQGIPTWFIFNDKGELLMSSFMKNQSDEGVNVGCPAEPQEVAYFIKVLEKTSSISAEQKASVIQLFSKASP